MFDVWIAGAYVGKPFDVGSWIYSLRRNGELVAEERGKDRPEILMCRLGAETAALAIALEAVVREDRGEDVIVRTYSAGLDGLLRTKGTGARDDVGRWYLKVARLAEQCSSLRLVPSSAVELERLRGLASEILPTPALPGRAIGLVGSDDRRPKEVGSAGKPV